MSTALAVLVVGATVPGACGGSGQEGAPGDGGGMDASAGGGGEGGAAGGVGGDGGSGGSGGSGATGGMGGSGGMAGSSGTGAVAGSGNQPGTGGTAGGAGAGASGGMAGMGGSSGTAGSAAAGGTGGGGGTPTCMDDGDCSGRDLCDPLLERCVACFFDSQCPTDNRCIDRQCIPITACQNSLDCTSDPEGRGICDQSSGECVECVQDADCTGDARCAGSICESVEPCDNSLDCTVGLVCDPTDKYCVECAADADCGTGSVCVARECVPECSSDTQCTPMGQLCDQNLSACVDCTVNADCPDVYYCSLGNCVLDACEAGTRRCEGNGIATCSSAGDGFSSPVACGARQTCLVLPTLVRCEDWVCTAGATECDGDVLVECSADGLTRISETDCTDQGLNCLNAACRNQICTPSQLFCDGKDRKRCSSNGLSATVVSTCGATEYCDDANVTCQPQVCTPSQPSCDGDIATTCNAEGSGYASGGTDCAAMGQRCASGQCRTCQSAADDLRFVEVFPSSPYVILENTSSACPADLTGLILRTAQGTTTTPQNYTLPAQTVQPGEQVTLIQPSAATGPNDIAMNFTLWGASGYAMLCRGDCVAAATTGDVIDALAFGTPPSFPSPVVMSPGPVTTSQGLAYRRVAFAGSTPTFQQSDWTVADPTRDGAGCPSLQPGTGVTCSSNGQVCQYSLAWCVCAYNLSSYVWYCQ